MSITEELANFQSTERVRAAMREFGALPKAEAQAEYRRARKAVRFRAGDSLEHWQYKQATLNLLKSLLAMPEELWPVITRRW